MEYKADYMRKLERLESGKEALPAILQQFSDDAVYSRLNRVALAEKCVLVWWDDEQIQEHLAASFTPTRVMRHSERSFPDTNLGDIQRRIGEKSDSHEQFHYPDISNDESMLKSLVQIHCTVAKKSTGYSSLVRVLSWKELRRYLKMNHLGVGASELQIRTGLLQLPH